MDFGADSRVSSALPYLVLTLGLLLYVLPNLPVLSYLGASYFASISYVVAGAFAWLYVRRSVEKFPYVLTVPAVTLLALMGMWLYFDPLGYYNLGPQFVIAFSSVSLFYVIGHSAGAKKWSYVVASVLAYFVSISMVAVVSLVARLPVQWVIFQLARVLVITLILGTPLALVAYVVSSRNQSGS